MDPLRRQKLSLSNPLAARMLLTLSLSLGLGLGFGLCNTANAMEPDVSPWSLSASYGEGARGQLHDAARFGIQRRWQARWWQTSWAHFTGYWDLSVADFDASDLSPSTTDRGASRIWAVALAPVVRWQFEPIGNTTIAPYLELAVGLSYLSDDRLRSGKQRSFPLGSHFQFEDRGVAGLRFGRKGRWELAYQWFHYSNLDLASSNHGIDNQLIMLGYRL